MAVKARTSKLELRIDLGPTVLGGSSGQPAQKRNYRSPYKVKEDLNRAQTTGAKPRDTSSFTMPVEEKVTEEERNTSREKKTDHAEKVERRKKKIRRHKAATKEAEASKTPKTILRNKDTPRSKSRVVIKEEENVEYEKDNTKREASALNRNTPAVTINTPLRGNPDSPLKPYKFRPGGRGTRSSLNRLTTPGTTSFSSRAEERKPIDIEAGKKATSELFSAIGVGTRMLEFKDMLQIKVAIGMEAHIPRDTLESLNTFEKIIDELSVLWKINRVDLDLLEYLLQRIGLLERFTPDLEKYKSTVGYGDLPATSEREVTTIISSLHNLLQGSEESGRNYTTMCFLHYGDVYHFNRARLSCMKTELSTLLRIQPTQMIYLAKVAADAKGAKGYLTVFQMPCSVTKRIVTCAKKNHDVLMSLGLKGIQITGSDGLRYTQSMNYLPEKVPVATQTTLEDLLPQTASGGRNVKTSMSISSLPPLLQQQVKSKSSSTSRPDTTALKVHPSQSRPNVAKSLYENWGIATPAPTPNKEDPSMIVQLHPDEEKFERRVKLLQSTLDNLSQSDVDNLVRTLLEQIQALHRTIASLKKDLKEKTRELNASQGFVQKAEKEIKGMEMRLETKAHQISEINQHLVKRINRVMNENSRLKESLQHLDAEIDIHRQLEKENRFGNSVRAVRITRPIQSIL